MTSQWRHDKRDGVSNHQRLDGLVKHLFRRRSKKTSKPPVTGLCEGNSPVNGEFPSQVASSAEMFRFDDVIMTWKPICLCEGWVKYNVLMCSSTSCWISIKLSVIRDATTSCDVIVICFRGQLLQDMKHSLNMVIFPCFYWYHTCSSVQIYFWYQDHLQTKRKC